MKEDSFKGVNLEICPVCSGVWFDDDELRRILELDPEGLLDLQNAELPTSSHHVGPVSQRQCPKDGAPLYEFHYLYDSPIILEKCPQCEGVWVEEGQLAAMQQVLDQARKPPTAKEEAGIALGEFAAEHEAEMIKQQRLLSFFTMLQRWSGGWIGLWP